MAKTQHTGTAVPADSGHAKKAFPPMDPSTFASQLVWLALTFGVLYLFLSRVSLPRIGEVIEERRDRIQRDLDEAEKLKGETESALAEYERSLSEAKHKAGVIAQEERAKVSAETEEKRAAAEAEEAKRIADAEARIMSARTAAMASVNEIAAETTNSIVDKLLGTQASSDEIKQALASLAPAAE